MEHCLLLPVFFPILAGVLLLLKRDFKERRSLLVYTGAVLVLGGAFAFFAVMVPADGVTLFYLTKEFPIFFELDTLGRFFSVTVTLVWVLAGFFWFEYIKHEKN